MAKHWSKRHAAVPAAWVFLERDGKVVLLRRYNTGYKDGQLTPPAGHIRDNEPPSHAAVREVMEEVGVKIKAEDLDMIHCIAHRALEGDHDRIDFFFMTSKFSGEPRNMEPDKADELVWVDVTDLPENTIHEVREALRHSAQGKAYSEEF